MAREGMGPMDATLVGAGRTLDLWGQGAKQGALQIGHLYSPDSMKPGIEKKLQGMKEEQGANRQAFSGVQREYPMASALGEALPYAAVPSKIGTMGQAGIVGGMEALKYGTPEERIERGIYGGATAAGGNYVSKALGNAIAPAKTEALTDTQRTALANMQARGLKPRMSQITGGKYARAMEDFAASTPGGMGVMQKFEAGNQNVINKAAAQSMGESAEELTPHVMADTLSRMGDVFDRIKQVNKKIAIGANVGAVADDIIRTQGKAAAEFQDARLLSIARQAKALAANRGKIDGEAYQIMRSNLSEAAYDLAEGSTSTAAKGYKQLVSALDDSAEQSLRAAGMGTLADDLKAVRPQYSNFKLLTKGKTIAKGDVNPQLLAGALRKFDADAFRTGKNSNNPLFDIGQYGEAFAPLREGSQTYQRETVSNPLIGAAKAPFAWLAAKAVTSPLATTYPNSIGKTQAALIAAKLQDPLTRAATIGALRAAVLPMESE